MAGATAREAEERGWAARRGEVEDGKGGCERVRVKIREETKKGHGGRAVIGVALLVGRELQQQLLRRRRREILAAERQPRGLEHERRPPGEGRSTWQSRSDNNSDDSKIWTTYY